MNRGKSVLRSKDSHSHRHRRQCTKSLTLLTFKNSATGCASGPIWARPSERDEDGNSSLGQPAGENDGGSVAPSLCSVRHRGQQQKESECHRKVA